MIYGTKMISNSKEFAEVFLAVQNMEKSIITLPYDYIEVIQNMFLENEDGPIHSYKTTLSKLDRDCNNKLDTDLLSVAISDIINRGNSEIRDDKEGCFYAIRLSRETLEYVNKEYAWQTLFYMSDFVRDFENACNRDTEKVLIKK